MATARSLIPGSCENSRNAQEQSHQGITNLRVLEQSFEESLEFVDCPTMKGCEDCPVCGAKIWLEVVGIYFWRPFFLAGWIGSRSAGPWRFLETSSSA